jgi:hypothetical protein
MSDIALDFKVILTASPWAPSVLSGSRTLELTDVSGKSLVLGNLPPLTFQMEIIGDCTIAAMTDLTIDVMNRQNIINPNDPTSICYRYQSDNRVEVEVLWKVNGAWDSAWTGVLDQVKYVDAPMNETASLTFVSKMVLAERVLADHLQDDAPDDNCKFVHIARAFQLVAARAGFSIKKITLPLYMATAPALSWCMRPGRYYDMPVGFGGDRTYLMDCSCVSVSGGEIVIAAGRDLFHYKPATESLEWICDLGWAIPLGQSSGWWNLRVLSMDYAGNQVVCVVNKKSDADMGETIGEIRTILVSL